MAIIGWHQDSEPSDAFVRALRSAQSALWPLFARAAARPLAPPVLMITDAALFDSTRSSVAEAAWTPPIAGNVTLARGLELQVGLSGAWPLALRPRARVIALSESRGNLAAARAPAPAITLEVVLTAALALESVRWLCGDCRAAGRTTEPFIAYAAARRILAEHPSAPRCLAVLDARGGLPAAPAPDDDRIPF